MPAPNETQVAFIFVVGTFAMLIMAGAIVLFVLFYQKKMIGEQLRRKELEAEYQQKMLRMALESQENERKRVSKDLHDDVGIMLQALKNTVLTIAKDSDEQDKKDIQDMVNEITESVRRISWDLMPSSLERFGLAEAVDELCSRLSHRNNTQVSFSQSGQGTPLDKQQDILLYRIVQEAITNALKHARASSIHVTFGWQSEQLLVEIADDGVGFELPQKEKRTPNQYGLGLYSMENRAALLHGMVAFDRNQPSGTKVQISLPLNGHRKN